MTNHRRYAQELEVRLAIANRTIRAQRRAITSIHARCCDCPIGQRVRASHDLHVASLSVHELTAPAQDNLGNRRAS